MFRSLFGASCVIPRYGFFHLRHTDLFTATERRDGLLNRVYFRYERQSTVSRFNRLKGNEGIERTNELSGITRVIFAR